MGRGTLRPGQEGLGSRDIQQLLAVADSGSIRRAAEMLGMTQPGLSKNVRSIEARLGMAVFERSTSGATPTEIGALLLRRGRQILLDLDAIHRDLRDELLSETGFVRFGAGPVVSPIISGQVIPQCRREHPGIALELQLAHPSELIARLERGDIEFYIGTTDGFVLPAGLTSRVFQELQPVFFVRAGHPLTQQPGLRLPDLADWKVACVRVNQTFERWYQREVGVPRIDIGLQCDDVELIGEAVESSDLVSFTSPEILVRLKARRNLVALDIPGVSYRHRIDCVQRAGRPASRPAQKVLQLIETAFAAFKPQ